MKQLFLVLVVGLTACNNAATDSNKSKADSTPAMADETDTNLSCYRQVIKRDTILLSLQHNDSLVSGTLSFDNFEKDASKGTVTGKIQNDRIVLWYRFFSEGLQSVMEVVFRKQGDQLIRAVGDMEQHRDTLRFKDPAALRFDSAQALGKIPCNK